MWLEKRKRIAALAMLTVVGLLVYGLIQRQVRQYLQAHQTSIPGNKGQTDMPTATVVFESFASVTRVDLSVEGMTISELYGWQVHHELICQALELDAFIYESPTTQENNPMMGNALEPKFKDVKLISGCCFANSAIRWGSQYWPTCFCFGRVITRLPQANPGVFFSFSIRFN